MTPTGAGVSFGGKVLAGSQPVSGATVQLYAAGNSGYWISGECPVDGDANDG